MILKIMDIIRFALAIIVALIMISVFLLLVKNDLKKKKKFNNQWLRFKVAIGPRVYHLVKNPSPNIICCRII
jgi:hypothetical protein